MIQTLSLISVLIIIIMLRRIVEILPGVFACVLRWRECAKIDAIVKVSRDRDLTASALIIPMLLVIQKHDLLPYRFLTPMSPEAGFGIITAIFIGYLALRTAVAALILPQKSHKKSRSADNSDRTFFIILAVVTLACSWILSLIHVGAALFLRRRALACSWILSLIHVEASAVRHTIIWLSAAIYMLYLMRKFQIFQSSHSIFTAFLYLCALEIVPTGILVVSAIIF